MSHILVPVSDDIEDLRSDELIYDEGTRELETREMRLAGE